MTTVQRLPDRYSQGKVPPALWLAMAGAFLIYFIPAFVLFVNYRQAAFDLGIYQQSLWLLADGGRFNTVAGIHIFGAHFSPILLLLAPLSWVSGPVPILLLQALIGASGLYPAYRLALLLDRDPRPFVLIYGIHPAIFSALWWGFRPYNFAAPFLMWAALALCRRPTATRMILLGLTALLIREDLAFWITLLGSVLVLAKRLSWRLWLGASAVLAIPTLMILLLVLAPLSPEGSYIYEDAVVVSESTTPLLWAGLFTAARVLYLWIPLGIGVTIFRLTSLIPLALPLAGLALRGGEALLTGLQYESAFIPLILLSIATGTRVNRPRIAYVIIGVLAAAIAFGPLRPPSLSLIGPNLSTISPAETRTLDAVRAEINRLTDSGTSLSLPSRLVSHYAQREQIFIFPYPFDDVSPEPYLMDCPNPDVVISDRFFRPLTPSWQAASSDYTTIYDDGRYRIHILRTVEPPGTPCGPAYR